jgi:hypothetical protein
MLEFLLNAKRTTHRRDDAPFVTECDEEIMSFRFAIVAERPTQISQGGSRRVKGSGR